MVRSPASNCAVNRHGADLHPDDGRAHLTIPLRPRSMSELVPGASQVSHSSVCQPRAVSVLLARAVSAPLAQRMINQDATAPPPCHISGGRHNMMVQVRLGVPPEAGGVDVEAVRAVFPYGRVHPPPHFPSPS